jgi:hypothetical protein
MGKKSGVHGFGALDGGLLVKCNFRKFDKIKSRVKETIGNNVVIFLGVRQDIL